MYVLLSFTVFKCIAGNTSTISPGGITSNIYEAPPALRIRAFCHKVKIDTIHQQTI